jgi:basic amino acid/polyamine antiporter, APA family
MIESKPHLSRTLGPGHVFGLAFGAILGAGWIVGIGQWLGQAGPFGALIGLAGGAFVMLLVSLCYAEAGSMFPSSGGEVDYADRFFGKSAGYIAGWLLALTYLSAAGFEAISIGWLGEALFPALRTRSLYSVFDVGVSAPSLLIGCGAVIAAGIVNYRGGRVIGRLQNLLTLALGTAAIVFVSAAFLNGNAANLEPHFVIDKMGGVFVGISSVFVTAPFWFSGFGVVSYSIGEIKPRTSLRLVAFMVALAIFASLAFYAATLFATALTLPRPQLLILDLPASSALQLSFNSTWLARLVLATGIVGLLMALNSLLFAASRVLFQLSQSGMLHPSLRGIHPQFRSPHRAVVLSTMLAVAATLPGRGAIGALVDICAVCICCVYAIICAGVARSRWRLPEATRPFRIPGGPLIPVVATLFAFAMIVAAFAPLLGNLRQLTFQAGIVLLWMGVGAYILWRGRS